MVVLHVLVPVHITDAGSRAIPFSSVPCFISQGKAKLDTEYTIYSKHAPRISSTRCPSRLDTNPRRAKKTQDRATSINTLPKLSCLLGADARHAGIEPNALKTPA